MLRELSVVIPARNESATIASVVNALKNHPRVAEVVVIDSASDDDTGNIARQAGAHVTRLEKPGYGRAVKVGFLIAKCNWIFKIDGDMRNVSDEWITCLFEKIRPQVGIVKAWWDSSEDPMPVTNLVVKPAISFLLPELSFVHMPISGIYLFKKSLININSLGDDYTLDLDLLVRIHRTGARIEQSYLGEVLDRLKPIHEYYRMAGDLLHCIHSHNQVKKSSPLMIVMAHPDDAEIWCGGTIAKVLNAGGVVELWIATDDKNRRAEAMHIQNIYSNIRVNFLGGAEFESISNASMIKRLAAAIRKAKPQVLITHHPEDDHPDHRACYSLVAGSFLLLPRERLPSSFYLSNSYFQSSGRSHFSPNTFIDISNESELKYQLIKNHKSQKTDYWIQMARTMDSLNGMKCGVLCAEAFERSSMYSIPKASRLLPA